MMRSVYTTGVLFCAVGIGISAGFLGAPYLAHTFVGEFGGTLVHTLTVARERGVYAAQLQRMEPADMLALPVIGANASDIADTYGASRPDDRMHEGVDIFAPQDTMVISATEGVVIRTGTNDLGGNIVLVLGPGGHRYYYAHLDAIDPQVSVGTKVTTTTPLGTVGSTGNASGTPPHLHFGIYGDGGSYDPFPLLES